MEANADLKKIATVISPLGFTLDKNQPHMAGERFLMMKDKYVLSATTQEGNRVILKVSEHKDGKKEIETEKLVRDSLKSMVFSNNQLLLPEEVYFGIKDNYLLWATEFVSQEKVFVSYPIETQFFKVLTVFEEQESFHATTFEHLKSIRDVFPIFDARTYFNEFKGFIESVYEYTHDDVLTQCMHTAYELLVTEKRGIDEFCNYLTHTDFVPHNFRTKDKAIYILDLSSIHFGNKYESWARFMNYMVIHNPALDALLSEYVRNNRGERDYLSLRMMRIYKIGFLLDYYSKSLSKTEGSLKKLIEVRINFWKEILIYISKDEPIPDGVIESYKSTRDSLRSEDEKRRQKEFAIA